MTLDKSDELTLLADFVEYPEATKKAVERFELTADVFVNETYRGIFRRFIESEKQDSATLFLIMAKILGLDTKTSKDRNELCNDHADAVGSNINGTAHRLVMQHYNRSLLEAVERAASVKDSGDCDALKAKFVEAIDSVVMPPLLGALSQEEQIALEMQAQNLEDIPNELLQAPGFINDLVEYSLKSAFNPNRTLSFAGALALTAHLAGRRYTDPNATRTNLFVFALAPSGGGKDHPRKVNRHVARATQDRNLPSTIFDKPASGEAIETTLTKYPRALFQMDEIQKELVKWKDERNPNAISTAQNLMTLYSDSGGDHSVRVKATNPNSIGCTICDPSLTLFATGIADDSFKAFTPSIVKEGMVGRCLMFDTAHVQEPNPFAASGRAELPPGIITQARLINNFAGGAPDSPDMSNPKVVQYDTGVDEMLTQTFKKLYGKAEKCRREGDEFGAALWGRASEKISKLALIFAISQNPTDPLIRRENVERAVKLIDCLIPRMLRRIDTYMAAGRVGEIANAILAFLALPKFKGRCKLRDFVRARKYVSDMGPHGDFQKAVDVLVARGELEVKDMGRKSIHFRLIK